ncbi:MAG: hypothetical protein OH319_01215 [Candidatus Parvarchaeota archaeon]|nr:hypothetical protein [Candidatus Jingweiarchaeum tengchongense]MCW1297809.1 hypothetical protein [Candidatus Jingweiarchaeum tengchongense]MCW1299819.1 hypothetical protein [Candidatus Jingweiarchaeum tengchongense]MCW1304210.1 hypothetical protein [Candidatus Jingweiarchaeum tengchongense]MCW1305238.1 hypothetical protein [Candidatus Jingweiarchaeum tengchongense]
MKFSSEIEEAKNYVKNFTNLDIPILFLENKIGEACTSYPWKTPPIVELNPNKFSMIKDFKERCAILVHEITECYSQDPRFYNKYPSFAQLIWKKKGERAKIAHFFAEILENEFRKENSMPECNIFRKIPKEIKKDLESVILEIGQRRKDSSQVDFYMIIF